MFLKRVKDAGDMRQVYEVAMKYCAYIHLGFVPDCAADGICPNLLKLLYDSTDCLATALFNDNAIEKELRFLFRSLGLNSVYPVEDSAESYAHAGDKYRGKYAAKRRELAGLIAQHFNQKLMQDTFKR